MAWTSVTAHQIIVIIVIILVIDIIIMRLILIYLIANIDIIPVNLQQLCVIPHLIFRAPPPTPGPSSSYLPTLLSLTLLSHLVVPLGGIGSLRAPSCARPVCHQKD